MFGGFWEPWRVEGRVTLAGTQSQEGKELSREKTEVKCHKKINFGEDGRANDLLNFVHTFLENNILN